MPRAETGERLYVDGTGKSINLDVAPDPAMVDGTWRTWFGEITLVDSLIARIDDLGQIGAGDGSR